MRQTASQPQLLTVNEAASLLRVNDTTIRRWIAAEKIPYLALPGGAGYRIPQASLLASLAGNFDLAAESRVLDEHFAGLTEQIVEDALSSIDT
ncbi:MAG: helix-turn-helix domain-containing protein [Solirubrobacterales bacterium]